LAVNRDRKEMEEEEEKEEDKDKEEVKEKEEKGWRMVVKLLRVQIHVVNILTESYK